MLGNVTAVINPDAEFKVMIAAHIDEIGLMIHHISEEGFLHFQMIGGNDSIVADGLYRSSIGFDRVFNLLNNPQRFQAADSWPPYDIVKKGENDYAICLAVAGFSMGDLDVTQERNVLIVKGGAAQKQEGEYLHRGISAQSFERRFELADHVHVEGASLANGLLTVTLSRATCRCS